MASGVSKHFPNPPLGPCSPSLSERLALSSKYRVGKSFHWKEDSSTPKNIHLEKQFLKDIYKKKNSLLTHLKDIWGTSLVVQWLRLHSPKAGALGSIPD